MDMNKIDATCEALEGMVSQLQAAEKLPTVRQLCADLAVSRMTLDRALTRLEDQGMIIRKHGHGIYANPGQRVHTVGLVLSIDPYAATASPYYRLFIDRVTQRCEQMNLGVRLYIDPADPEGELSTQTWKRLNSDITNRQVHGLLIPASNRHLERLWHYDLPVLGSGEARVVGLGVVRNRGRMMYQAVGTLVRRGCQRIGLIHHLYEDDRRRFGSELEGLFEEHLRRWDRPFNPDWLHIPTCLHMQRGRLTTRTWEEEAYHGAVAMFDPKLPADRKPDGLIVLDDVMTRGCLVALHRAGLHPGKDVVIVSHSVKGSPTLLGYEQDLIRLEVDPIELADLNLDMLVTLMQGRKPNPSLIVYDSVMIQPNQAEPAGSPDRSAEPLGSVEGK